MKYIPAEKLIAEIERLDEKYRTIRVNGKLPEAREADLVIKVLRNLSIIITSLQQEQPEADFEANGIITNAGGQFGYDVATFSLYDNHAFTVLLPHDDNAKYGDKVKLTIIKER